MQLCRSPELIKRNPFILNHHLKLYFSLVISHTVCSSVSTPTPHPFLTTWWSVHCQAIWSVMLFTPPMSQKGKKKNLWQDMMTCPGGVFHWSLGLTGEGSQQDMCVCVCTSAYSIWYCVYPRPCVVVLWCWVSPCSGLSPAARETSCETDRFVFCTHLLSFFPCAHTWNHIHTKRHTFRHTHTFMASGLSTHAHASSPHIHTYPQTITQAAGSLSHAS